MTHIRDWNGSTSSILQKLNLMSMESNLISKRWNFDPVTQAFLL